MSLLRRAEKTTRMYTINYSNDFSDTKQSRVVEIHSTDQWRSFFDASKRNNKLLVVQFTATWCRPCRFMDPTVQEFAAKFTDVDFIKIDVDKLMKVADQFEATTLPAFVLIKKGKQVDKVVGAKRIDLHNKIEQQRI
ncbi:thioredoxin H7 [Ricinus communis]|uniref:Thioredoxin H-type, putative n=1 Tax=Ricinus communis TaxID=3988 RepID=B9S2D9_RICCO|nr:thioredoxin H7 [Ricinus communis]EEF42213.1 Thioredoxin H-type, putative [Ricinus communis]|eukprot:XP_002520158.1 thioredoxin H7 [Ricinus communis]